MNFIFILCLESVPSLLSHLYGDRAGVDICSRGKEYTVRDFGYIICTFVAGSEFLILEKIRYLDLIYFRP